MACFPAKCKVASIEATCTWRLVVSSRRCRRRAAPRALSPSLHRYTALTPQPLVIAIAPSAAPASKSERPTVALRYQPSHAARAACPAIHLVQTGIHQTPHTRPCKPAPKRRREKSRGGQRSEAHQTTRRLNALPLAPPSRHQCRTAACRFPENR